MAKQKHSAQQRRAAYAKLVERAWSDDAFKAKFKSDPHAALAEYGIEVPAGMKLEILENTPSKLHLPLPRAPEGELSEEELESVAGGLGLCGACPLNS